MRSCNGRNESTVFTAFSELNKTLVLGLKEIVTLEKRPFLGQK